MKNLFFVPFAFDQSKASGVNISKEALSVYLKNLCVSLISAKKVTPEIDVALVCNIQIPSEYERLLLDNDVLIYTESFDSFLFDDEYQWCLAFYKLCALEKMVNKYDYDNYIYTDADVFVQTSLDKLYLELKDHILLYDINHGLSVKDYEIIKGEFNRFGIDTCITHYGGEFFGASREKAKIFIAQCKRIYDEMRAKNFVTTKGDEFILSIAAYRMRDMIKNAGAYVYRFWTGSFYLVSTCYQYNEIAILHLPGEKQSGMLRLYNIFVRKKAFPKKEKVHRICHLTHPSTKIRIKHALIRLRKVFA